MREIKCRAWDEKNKVMIPPELVGSLGGQPIIADCDFKGADHISVRIAKELVLLEFTGLKDKKGKEIYEGDIVKTGDKYYPRMIVNYTAGIINEHDGDWDEWYCGFDLGVPGDECKVLHYSLGDDVEIIGNIYENKELLK